MHVSFSFFFLNTHGPCRPQHCLHFLKWVLAMTILSRGSGFQYHLQHIHHRTVSVINCFFSYTCSASFSPKWPQFNEDLNHTVGNESQHTRLCKTLLEQIRLEWQNVISIRKAEQGRSASVCWTGIVFEICASYSASGPTSSYRQTPSTCISSKAEWKCCRFDSGVYML